MSSGFDLNRLNRVVDLCNRYVEESKIPCAQVQVAHGGNVVLRHTTGMADIESAAPLMDDAIFRIYSMTKPITSIALMQLYEQGKFLLEDPVEKFLPSYKNPVVLLGGSLFKPELRPAETVMTIRDLLTHTSGLTYGFHFQNNLDQMYRDKKLGGPLTGGEGRADASLEEAIDIMGGLPLLFDPGTAWNYSMSTDVCGRLIEVIGDCKFDDYLEENIFSPLGMIDTGFLVPQDKIHRFTSTYILNESGALEVTDPAQNSPYQKERLFLSGGGGLVSTTDDYQRFVDMLSNEGAADGNQIIGRRTLELMTMNHLPQGKLLNEVGRSTFSETALAGMGFGLGFSVLMDPAANAGLGTIGEFAWGGAASTRFWVDPVEKISCIFMTQFMPSGYYPIRRELTTSVYQAIK
ncbi:MAG: serine hydrolase domain-containing protein [Acidimicrobiales bacterium]|nr:beta-lactamase family protein [Acidimicrobiaceae bacterium]|tara:strand:- start:9876 stop:11093 length:1218 start_codon:yes stop_codon:yes gene_type:complete